MLDYSYRRNKSLLTYFEVLKIFGINMKAEWSFMKMITSHTMSPKSLRYDDLVKLSDKTYSLADNRELRKYLDMTTPEKHEKLMQSLLKHRAHDFVYDGLKIKMNTAIVIIEYENGDKMYYKLTEINTIRYLGGFIERKKNRGKLTFKRASDFEIFISNYKLNYKLDNKRFNEILSILR